MLVAARIADRIAILEDGRIVHEGPVAEAGAPARMRELLMEVAS